MSGGECPFPRRHHDATPLLSVSLRSSHSCFVYTWRARGSAAKRTDAGGLPDILPRTSATPEKYHFGYLHPTG